jgi:hypothetical protein
MRSLLALIALSVATLLVAGSALAQTSGDPQPEPAGAEGQPSQDPAEDAADLDALLGESADTPPSLAATGNDLSLIEDLLAEGDEALQSAYVYDGGGRRDPFRSLLVVADPTDGSNGPRPEGIPGLLIDEVTLTGVWITPDGAVAQVQSADQAVSYLLREGDRLFDGDVTSITYSRETGGEIRFRQIVDDPTAPKPFRDVVRKLEP